MKKQSDRRLLANRIVTGGNLHDAQILIEQAMSLQSQSDALILAAQRILQRLNRQVEIRMKRKNGRASFGGLR